MCESTPERPESATPKYHFKKFPLAHVSTDALRTLLAEEVSA